MLSWPGSPSHLPTQLVRLGGGICDGAPQGDGVGLISDMGEVGTLRGGTGVGTVIYQPQLNCLGTFLLMSVPAIPSHYWLAPIHAKSWS